MTATTTACPHCGSEIVDGQRFCEECGAPLPAEAAGAGAGVPEPVPAAAPPGGPVEGTLLDGPTAGATDLARHRVNVVDVDLSVRPVTCAACAGRIADDGYCEQCGAPAPRARDHWREEPASWVAAVCDRGVRHTRNEDAVAVAAAPRPGSFAAVVVCDGVSSAPDSDIASLAAARAARDALVAGVPATGVPPGGRPLAAVLAERLIQAGAAAQDRAAAAGATVPAQTSPPSCTFAAAVVQGGTLAAGWVGDSRVYWLPDEAPARMVSTDDSWAAEAIGQGVPRQEAERMPMAHAITRWLGVDSPDPVPRTMVQPVAGAGWVLVCSDGLWNYCSDAADLAGLVAGTAAELGGPAVHPGELAEALVAFANGQGGQDNVTVALVRVDGTGIDDEDDDEAKG